jgi:hypothetical protein
MARDISKKQKESTLAKELKREISQGKKDPKSRKAVAKTVLTGLSLLPIGKAIQVGSKSLKGVNTALNKKIATKRRKDLKTVERKAYLKSRKSERNRNSKKLKYAIKEPTLHKNVSIDLKATKNLEPKKKVNIDLKATKNLEPKKKVNIDLKATRTLAPPLSKRGRAIKGANDLVKAMDGAIERVTGIKSTKKYSRGGGVATQGTKFKGTF